MRTIYVVGYLKEQLSVSAKDGARKLIIEAPCTWAKGMCGAFPAFWDRKDAERYQKAVGKRYPIIDFEVDISATLH